MHYVKLFNINGVDTKQVACIELQGAPNAATEGAVGVLGMDVTSPTHEVYRCVEVKGSVYTWQLLSAGMSIVSAKITREGAEVTSFAYEDLKIPANYILKAGDLILDTDGYLYQVNSIGGVSCDVEYCGVHLGGAGTGDKDYRLVVSSGKLRLVTENGNVLSSIDFLSADEATIHRDPFNGKASVMAIKTVNETMLHMFVGTQAEYDVLTDDQKQNLFAIITDDPMRDRVREVINTVDEVMAGSQLVPKASHALNATGAQSAVTASQLRVRAPVLNEDEKLTDAGYYLVSMVINTTGRDGVRRDYRYNFGLVYWDGVNECALPAIENFLETLGGGESNTLYHGYITSSGDIVMWSCNKTGTSHSNITNHKVYTVRIGT